MAQLAVGVVGAAVGFAVGGPVGASIGWSLGAAAGGYLFAPKTNTEGPRLREIRYSQSSYGQTLPILLGAHRVGGNVIWLGELKEYVNTEKVGKNAYVTNYTYRQSLAVALTAGPVQAINRIWFDNKLVYSADYNDVVEALQTGALLEIMTQYYGSDTQLPDPVIEAELGIGEVPAYRGVCYIVLEELDLTEWGNRIPSISAEVIENGTYGVPNRISEIQLSLSTNGASIAVSDGAYDWTVTTWITDNTTGPPIWAAQPNITYKISHVDIETGEVVTQDWAAGNYFVFGYDGSSEAFSVIYPTAEFNLLAPLVCTNNDRFAFQGFTQDFPLQEFGAFMIRPPGDDLAGVSMNVTDYYTCVTHQYFYSGFLYFIGKDTASTGAYIRRFGFKEIDGWYIDNVGNRVEQGQWTVLDDSQFLQHDLMQYGTDVGGGTGWVAVDEVEGFVYCTWGGVQVLGSYVVFRFDANLELLEAILVPDLETEKFAVWNGQLLHCSYIFNGGYTLRQVKLNKDGVVTGGAISTLGTVTEMGEVEGGDTGDINAGPWFGHVGRGVVVTQDAEYSMAPKLAEAGRTLAEMVEKITNEAGVTSGDRDVSDLEDTIVPGYVLERRMSARSAVDPLLAGYGVDAVESNGKIKFVMRGGSPAGTFYLRDLGAMDEAGDDDTPIIQSTRGEQVQLPQRVDVNYADPAGGYQIGSQTAVRGTVRTDQLVTADLPIAMSADTAAQAAYRLLHEPWLSRTSRQFASAMKYAAYEPTDVVLLEEADGSAVRARIVGKEEDGGLIRWEVVNDDDGVTVQVATGGSVYDQPSLILRPSQTRPAVFETPPLSDQHVQSIVMYAAGAPTTQIAYRGGTVWSNPPNSTNFESHGNLAGIATMGSTITALADWTVDKGQAAQGSLQVGFYGGDPESVTEEELLDGANLLLVGRELIQFKTATNDGNGLWTLSGLLRGLHGTDYASTGHGIGEQIVLIDSAITPVVRDVAQLGTTRQWRTVSNGRSVPESPYVTRTTIGQTMRPLSPAHVVLVREANDDRTIKWTRRSRGQQVWRDSVDMPLLESVERYRVTVLDPISGATLRTATVDDVTEWTYTAANWFADFGLEPASATVRVEQYSASVGYGERAELVIGWPSSYNYRWTRDWDDDVVTGQTLYFFSGAGSIHSVVTDEYKVNNDSNTYDCKSRLDLAPTTVADALIQCDVKTPARGSAGLLARTTYWRNAGNIGFGYALLLNKTGTIQFGKGTNSDTATFTSLYTSAALFPTENTVVRLALRMIGTSFQIYANDALLTTITDTAHASGALGFYIGADAVGGFAAFFDNYQVDY